MPATLAATFERRRAESAHRGWPTPDAYFAVSQREQKVWLDYWAALDQRLALADFVVHSSADIPPPPG